MICQGFYRVGVAALHMSYGGGNVWADKQIKGLSPRVYER